MKRTVIGVVAHVDAGKTTLSEAMLYTAGAIRSLGRVDHGNAFLDNFSIERARGITIFSKQAILQLPGLRATLLDTPGHVDFSAETERVLDVLDCAILVISGSEGVQSHTLTLWKLLRRRGIPTFLFVNKMDLPGTDRKKILADLSKTLDGIFFDYRQPDHETVALCGDGYLEEFLETGVLSPRSIMTAVHGCAAFPCWFGAALKLDGVDEFLQDVAELAPICREKNEFGAKVFKITRDDQNARLTHMKVTGGVLRVRDIIKNGGAEEKVTQLRAYSGAKFTQIDEAYSGDVVAVTGLGGTLPGMGLGKEAMGQTPTLEPVLTYTVNFPEGCDLHKAVSQLRQLEEEEPELRLVWNERLQQMRAQLMGPIQLEILHEVLLDRFGLNVSFGTGQIIYRETIADIVEGVGHYEPLRHYAEVHLILEPGAPGSGIRIESDCSEDKLDRNWQRLILTHLSEKQHLGVLTGSPITDIKITLTAGRAHEKHTEGGDFREATYRALRQGLMQAKSVLLEPWYSFRLELPTENLGRAMGDFQRLGAEVGESSMDGAFSVLTGEIPVSALGDYPTEIASYTHGLGRFFCNLLGYRPCADPSAVIAEIGYDPEADLANSPDSVFCSHGAGHPVKWSDVPKYMHLDATLATKKDASETYGGGRTRSASDEELMAIFERTYGPIKRNDPKPMRPKPKPAEPVDWHIYTRPKTDGDEYLLVDGYNIIYAWDSLREFAEQELAFAREKLIERLQNYQGYRKIAVIVVFDAYKVKGNPGSMERRGGVTIVYTREAETADAYIERATYDLARKHFVRVATSDGLEQVIILGHGALRVPATAFEQEMIDTEGLIRNHVEKINSETELAMRKASLGPIRN